MRAGRRLSHPVEQHLSYNAHAVQGDGEFTVCGVDVASLYPFPAVAFGGVNPNLRCKQCSDGFEMAGRRA